MYDFSRYTQEHFHMLHRYLPVQVNTVVRRQLPDVGCTNTSNIDQMCEGKPNIHSTDPTAIKTFICKE